MLSYVRFYRSVGRWSILFVAVALLLVTACASTDDGDRFSHPVHVTEVVVMSLHGVPPNDIVEKMHRSGIVYRLSEIQYEDLRERSVTPRVIHYMKRTYAQAVENNPKLKNDEDFSCWYLGYDGYWYGGGPDGFHPDCEEVDSDTATSANATSAS
jgi:hypothetical protein